MLYSNLKRNAGQYEVCQICWFSSLWKWKCLALIFIVDCWRRAYVLKEKLLLIFSFLIRIIFALLLCFYEDKESWAIYGPPPVKGLSYSDDWVRSSYSAVYDINTVLLYSCLNRARRKERNIWLFNDYLTPKGFSFVLETYLKRGLQIRLHQNQLDKIRHLLMCHCTRIKGM